MRSAGLLLLLPLIVALGCQTPRPTAPVEVPFALDHDASLLTLPLPGELIERMEADLEQREVREEVRLWLRQLFSGSGPTLGFQRTAVDGQWQLGEPAVVGTARVNIRFEDVVIPVTGETSGFAIEPVEGGFHWQVDYLVKVGSLRSYRNRLEATAVSAQSASEPHIHFAGSWAGPFPIEAEPAQP